MSVYIMKPGIHSRTYSIVISLLVLLFITPVLIVNELADFSNHALEYIILGLLLVAGTFLIVNFFFNRFLNTIVY